MANVCGNLMSPMHISKLGHEIEEIRHRALKSIYSKYSLDLVDESNVENNKNLIENLLNFFNYDNPCDEGKALNLLLRVAKADNFNQVVKDLDGDLLLTRLRSVETKTEGRNLPTISEIKDLILGAKRKETKPVITELVIQDVPEEAPDEKPEELIFLPWQGLSKVDKQILESSYEGLRYLDDSSAIILTCQFLNDVILQDFPCEVFLQRPLVVRTLLELAASPLLSERTSVLKSILEISERLLVRIINLFDPAVTGTRWEKDKEVREINIEASEDLQRFQMSISGFCDTVFEKISPIFGEASIEDRNLALCLVLRCVMIKTKANCSTKIPKLFEENLGPDTSKPVYYSLLSSLLLLVKNPAGLSLTLRAEIFRNIGDPALLYFFPELHDSLLNFVADFRDLELEQLLKDFEHCINICESMDAAKKLENNLDAEEYFNCLLQALPSFEFHKNTRIVEDFVKKCAGKLSAGLREISAEILVKFLAKEDVAEVAYRAILSWVVKSVEDDRPFAKLDFLMQNVVWKEMWMFGASSERGKVRLTCREILNELLKSDNEKILRSLEPVHSVMSAYTGLNSPFSRSIVRLFDPTSFLTLNKLNLILGNIRLMFCKEIDVNEEGFARLCWLLSQDDPSSQKLPKISDIKGLHLSSMCISVKPKLSKPAGFSTSRALNETMNDLKAPAIASNDRNRVLNKLAAILEDKSLHDEFLEQKGLEMALNLLDAALVEKDLSVYPTSVFPLMSIFKSLAHNAAVRQTLSSNDSFLLNALRSLLLFTADEVFRQNAVCLLFLLVYNDQILEVSGCDKISLPEIITKNVHLPLSVSTHAKISPFSSSSNRIYLMGNPMLSRVLRVHWAIVCMGSLENLTALTITDLRPDLFTPNLPKDMLLQPLDLLNLQGSDPRLNLLSKLEAIRVAGSHSVVAENIIHLISSLTWLETWKTLAASNQAQNDVDSLPWITTFERFFSTLPKSMDDEALLTKLVALLCCLLRTTSNPDLLAWIRGLLTNPAGVFVELVKSMSQSALDITGRQLRYGIIQLAQEFIQKDCASEPGPWIILLSIIDDYLETNLADHLACFLSLMVDITGTWAWDYASHEKLYKNIVTHVIEVLVSFKGVAESRDSFMGSNIINNSLLILGHMLCDASSNILDWEKIWGEAMRQAAGVENLFDADYSWLLTLVSYRDPITRASALTLLSGLFASAKAYHLLVDGLDMGIGEIWATALAIVTDGGECALVREKAAVLLERLTTLGARTDCSDFLEYIKKEGIYEKVSDTLDAKTTTVNLKGQNTTNFLVNAMSNWIFAVLALNKSLVAQHITESSLMGSLIKMSAQRNETTDDWLLMNASIVRLIRACVKASPKARDVLLTSTCVGSTAASLTIPGDGIYLRYLQLECFYLLAVVLETEKGVAVFEKSLPADREALFEVIAESVALPLLRQRVLVFVNNFAVPKLGKYFSQKIGGLCFGEVLCDRIMDVNSAETFNALASLFLVCREAQDFALQRSGCETFLKRVRKLTLDLGAHSVIEFRKPSVKKKLEPLLKQLENIFSLLTNFCHGNLKVKVRLAKTGLADAVHKLWPWYSAYDPLRKTALQMLCSFSHQSETASQAIAITAQPSSIRKGSLIQSIIQLVGTEMDQLSKIRDTADLMYSMQILSNCCRAPEGRVALAKGTVLEPVVKILPTENKKKNFSEDVFEIWIRFLNEITVYPEGQLCVSMDAATMDLIFMMAKSENAENRKTALAVIFHLSLHPKNRCRLLTKPAPLLNLLLTVFKSGDDDEIVLAAATLWCLAANSQKAKIIIRSAGCGEAMEEAMQICENTDYLSILSQSFSVISDK